MQRTSTDHTNVSPLAQPSSNGYPLPGHAGLPGQTLAPPPSARAWPTLPELANALKRRLVLATFLGLLVGMAAGAGVWLAMPNGKHQVKALVQMTPPNKVLSRMDTNGENDSFKQTQMILMKTHSLLTRVVGNAKVSRLSLIQNTDDPIRYLDEQVRMRWESPEILAVVINGDDPQQLKVILDALLTEYIDEAKSDEIKLRERKRKNLESILLDLNKKITYSEGQLKAIQKTGATGGSAGDSAQAQLLGTEISQTQSQINAAKIEMRQHELKLVEDDTMFKRLDDLPVDPELLERAVAERLRDKAVVRARKEAEVKKLASQLNPGSPVLVAAQEELKAVDAEIKAAFTDMRPAAEREIRAAKRQELRAKMEVTQELLKHHQRRLVSLEEYKKNLDDRFSLFNRGAVAGINEMDDLKPLKAQRDVVQREKMDLELNEKADTRVTLREEARVILNQNLKQKVLLSLAGALVGLTLIMLAVAFLEWRSRRVDSVEQVVNELGLRVIGTIPAFPSKASLKSGDAGQSQNWRFVLNESVNSARTMLLHTAKTQNMQVLMVTSAMQGEGKTSLASQLATSMATAGLRTLVLDCDLRNPSMHKLFDAPLTPGCSEILCQEVDVSDAVQPTTVPNLWLIPAGQCSNRVIAALAQGHPLETLFNRLRGQFDFIVVDSCPVLPVADALLVGQHVDGVVISILQDISQLPKVMTASEKLTQLNIPLLGAVVNGIKPDIHAYGYNYVKQLPA
jgi:capsular exopolysaccharide synthesis family protein